MHASSSFRSSTTSSHNTHRRPLRAPLSTQQNPSKKSTQHNRLPPLFLHAPDALPSFLLYPGQQPPVLSLRRIPFWSCSTVARSGLPLSRRLVLRIQHPHARPTTAPARWPGGSVPMPWWWSERGLGSACGGGPSARWPTTVIVDLAFVGRLRRGCVSCEAGLWRRHVRLSGILMLGGCLGCWCRKLVGAINLFLRSSGSVSLLAHPSLLYWIQSLLLFDWSYLTLWLVDSCNLEGI